MTDAMMTDMVLFLWTVIWKPSYAAIAIAAATVMVVTIIPIFAFWYRDSRS